MVSHRSFLRRVPVPIGGRLHSEYLLLKQHNQSVRPSDRVVKRLRCAINHSS